MGDHWAMYAEATRRQAVKAEGSFHFRALLLQLLRSTATVSYIHSTTRIENPPRHRYYRQITILRHFTKNVHTPVVQKKIELEQRYEFSTEKLKYFDNAVIYFNNWVQCLK